MDELDIVRGLMLRTAGALPATAPLAKALLEWAAPHRPWLLPDVEGECSWETLLASLAAPRHEAVRAEALELAGTLARLLGLSPVDAALLRPRGDGGEMTTYAVPAATAARPATTSGTSAKSAPYDAVIEEHATAQGVSPDLVRAVIQVESAFNPQALSPKGAMGLMQLMPATARELVRDTQPCNAGTDHAHVGARVAGERSRGRPVPRCRPRCHVTENVQQPCQTPPPRTL